jgi:hypothetical protein
MSEPAVEPLEATTLELACALYASDITFATGKHTFGIARPGLDLNNLVAQHGAVLSMRQTGGLQTSWQIVARITVTTYAATYQDVWDAQQAFEARIVGRWRPNTAPGDGGIRIDSWRNESAAAEQPYPGLSVLTSIWRVTTRHMPA